MLNHHSYLTRLCLNLVLGHQIGSGVKRNGIVYTSSSQISPCHLFSSRGHCDPPPSLALGLHRLRDQPGHFHKSGSEKKVTFQLILESCRGLLRLLEARYGLLLCPKSSNLEPAKLKGRWESQAQDPPDFRLCLTKWVYTHFPTVIYTDAQKWVL